MFKYDESNTGITPVESGIYEAYPCSYEVKTTQNTGNQMIVMSYRIRDDVNQPSAGGEVHYDNFVDTPKAQWRANLLTKATNAFKNGMDFGTIENWAEQMLGKPIRIKVKVEINEQDKRITNITGFSNSQVPMQVAPNVKRNNLNAAAANVAQGMEQQQAPQQNYGMQTQMNTASDPFKNNSSINISDDDLPF
ncbi:DUF669 domain-containing protein [Latilactobacillus curvatus]|uniref:DUF669 domain-containing protein n=1 Tax=Latilactobacillus curvatus TaxID=28038 RepID=UPI002D76CCF2|nr:DUF669 domain-containing protein [Latilactobacillus curvatus]WRS47036.1 DUF669 domain-containing protein [Latilactobacillus curvatus]